MNETATELVPTRFADLSISDDLKAVTEELGFTKMTPIQAASIPLLLGGRDLVGQSKTGSGKTAAFALPILHSLVLEPREVQALILCPTRELCTQVAREIRRLGRRVAGLQVLVACGGIPGRPQAEALRKGVHIVVGTPGRVLDHLSRRNLWLGQLRTFVLDEADRMLDMGFADEMNSIFEVVPPERQTVLFSATMPEEISKMSAQFQKSPALIRIEETTKTSIQQYVYDAESEDKVATLFRVLKQFRPNSAIVFCNLKVTVAELQKRIQAEGISCGEIHGDLEQSERDEVMALFRNGSRRILVATDVAARGLDIPDLDLVVNFDLPIDVETYVHRIGRTGRAGKTGIAASLATSRQRMRVYDFAKIVGPINDGDTDGKAGNGRSDNVAVASEMQTLWISGGRKEKVRPGDILGALTGEAGGLPATDVGKIEIHDHFAYVAVTKKLVPLVIQKLQGGRIKGRKFLIRTVG